MDGIVTQKPALSFSCIVDRPAKIQSAAIRWAHALIKIENVDPSRIFIQCVAHDLPILEHFRSLGTNVILTERFGDGKHCNKLIQLDCHDQFEDGAIVLFDCDTVCTGQFSEALGQRFQTSAHKWGDKFAIGKTVDAPNPPVEMFQRLRDHFQIAPEFRLTAGTLEGALTLDGYFNGGLYCLSTSRAADFSRHWKDWALRLIETPEAKRILGLYFWHVDQISFYFAAVESGLALETLDNRFNCATHFAWPKIDETSDTPFVIHYHNNLHADGRIGLAGSRAIDRATNCVNDLLANTQMQLDERFALNELKAFSNWEDIEPTMSITSKNLAQLHATLRIAGIEEAETVAEYRCASARHIAGLSFKSYRGFDERVALIEQAQQRFPNQQFAARALRRTEAAELVICLDVAGALTEYPSVESLIEELAHASTHALLVGGECVTTALLGDDPEVTLDIAGLLRRTGQFDHVLPLTRHGGRELYLALKPAAIAGLVGDGPLGLHRFLDASADPAKLLMSLLSARAAKGMAPNAVDAASLFEYPGVLTMLGDNVLRSRVGVIEGPTSPLSLTLSARGANVRSIPAARMTAPIIELPQFDSWIIARSSWRDVAAQRADILGHLTGTLVPGGSLILTFDLKKRTNDIIASDSCPLTLTIVQSELANMGYLILDLQIVPLPYNIAHDLALIRAIYLGKEARQSLSQKIARVTEVQSELKSRTTRPLRDFERTLRHMIRGTKPND